MNVSSRVPVNVTSKNHLNNLEATSSHMSHIVGLDAGSISLGDPSPTPFPSLTGLRSGTKIGKSNSVTIGSSVTRIDLHKATANLGASPIAALQAAWAVILSTYTAAQDDVGFTTLIASSECRQSDHLGESDFSTILTRVCLDSAQECGHKTTGSLLHHLTQSNALALHRSKLPAISATRHEDLGRHGTVVALKSNGCSKDDDGASTSSPGLLESEKHAVGFVAWPDLTGALKLEVHYIDTYLNETSALVMLKQLDEVLAFILANPAERIANCVSAIGTSLLSKSNETLEESIECNLPPYLQAQFEYFAFHNPYRVALDFRKDLHEETSSDNTTWTYEQLNDRAESFATYLIHRFGQLNDEVIPICMERRPELYVAILGILKTGGAWCPIDSSFPARRRHHLIARTGARMVIVAEQNSVDTIEIVPKSVITIDVTRLVDTTDNRFGTISAKMGSLAYLVWTSGTTGDPKGVPIHHEAAVNSMRALQRAVPANVSSGIVRCLQFSQFTFDVFVQDLFYTWGVGGTVISSTQEIMLGSFAELSTKTGATHAHLTPTFAASVPRERCPTLEVVTMIGEKLSQAVADDWSHDMRAFNTYGPAETTVVSTLRQFGAAGDNIRSENIGFPLVSVSAFVMRDDRPLMRHGIGELALGGPQLSKGYWNDPERSFESFVWNDHCSRHLYMTGDLVRQLHDGSFEFIGRTDDLIKIQGIRVELSEISFSLRACHPLVEQVEVLYLHRQDRPSKVIVAFLAAPDLNEIEESASEVIAGKDSVPVVQGAMREAQKNLPGYMVPSVFLVLSRIPRTSSAKVNKAALEKFYSSVDLAKWERTLTLRDNNVREVTTWSTRESALIAVLAELSGTCPNSINRSTDLRSIGLDSIAVTRLAPLLNANGFCVSVADILQCRILNDIATLIDKPRSIRPMENYDLEAFHNEWYNRVRNVIETGDVFVAPALPLQESLLSESMQDASAYWSHVFFSLGAKVDISLLLDAWLQVVSDTEALRTGFIPSASLLEHENSQVLSNSTFLQLIYAKPVIDWKCMKSSETDMKEIAVQRAHVVVKSHQEKYFRNPLLAITIFELPERRVMMLSVHHSVRDETSLEFVLEDVSKSYQKVAGRSNQRHQLREALQVMLPTKAQKDRDDEYWSKTLKDFATTGGATEWPDLTGKKMASEDQDVAFITHTRALNLSYEELQIAALSFGASSAASILRVAWGLVLLEYLGTDSVVFGETWSTRIDEFALADVIGPLLTVLPVPFRAQGSARETLIAQSDLQRCSSGHRSVHSQVVKKILGRSEKQVLYPAVFNFLPGLKGDSRNGCSSIWNKIDNIVSLTVEHPLALNVTQKGNGVLEMEISASRKVMSSDHLAILAVQVNTFVETMIKFPDMPLTQLSSQFPKDMLSVTSVSFSENVRLAWKQNPTDWVDHYAAVQPDWLAAQVVTSLGGGESDYESWSFAELHSAYKRVAAFIIHGGFSSCMIAVCLDRRIETYAIILGILASGNTYLPIDEDLPRERKSFLVQDSKAAMVFTTRSLALTFPPESRVIYVDDPAYMEQMVNGNAVNLPSQVKASNNAYLLYTSGSTGVPKGVLVGRGNLCSFIEGLSEFIFPLIPGMKDLPGKGKYLGLASRAFDVHIAEMFLAWRQGLAAVTASRTMLLDNLELALRKLRITHASFVPSLVDQAGLDPANLPDLHYLGVGGEKMSNRVVDTWASNDNATLVNAYGPTEMSIGCTAAEVTPESNLRNVGRPYGNSIAHILVPGSKRYTLRGVAGELCFTGDLVANGYHNRPDAKGFVDDFNGERMYRTGDIVRLMADDTVEYLRREDDQTKVRGQRLELGEITEAIRSTARKTLGLQKIDVATMIAQHPKLSRPQLVSFVVPIPQMNNAPGCPETLGSARDYSIASEIRKSCQKVLPAYMVPDVVIPITKLPLAPSSGKADLKRLKVLLADMPIADMTRHVSSEDSIQPRSSRRELTVAERDVLSAITSALNVHAAEIAADTNIFRLGLDSLSAISLAIKIQQLGYDCTVSSVLRNPFLEQLALLPHKDHYRGAPTGNLAETKSRIADLESKFRAIHPQGLGDLSIQAVKPCLPLQETLVATSLNDKSSALYVNHVALRLSIEIDRVRLYKAWARVVADHEILRTCFQEFDDGFVQVVLEYGESRSVRWKEMIIEDPESAFRLQQSKLATEIISDIASKAPIRLTLFRPPSDVKPSILMIAIHHALYDGESFAVILEELNMRYHSAIPSAHTPFDSLIEYVYSQDQDKSKTFWTDYLAHYRAISSMNGADDMCENPNIIFQTVDRTFASPLTELESFSSSISGTPTSTVQAVFGIILAQVLKNHDVVFGAVLSGRTLPIETRSIVAPCITTIPQRVNLRGDGCVITDIVKEAQQGFIASLEFQHTALRHIHRWLGVEKPLFDCLVSYIQRPEPKSRPCPQVWTELESSMPNDFPLSVEFEADHEADRIHAHCTFSPAFGDLDKGASLLESIDLLLGALVRREDVTTEDLEFSKSGAVELESKPSNWDESHWTPRELKMRGLAAEICGIDAKDISKGASFFSLGIDSITAIRFAQGLRHAEIECSSADVMRHSCIAALAQKTDTPPSHDEVIRTVAGRPLEDDLKNIMPKIPVFSPRDTVTDVYFCTPLQSSMLTQTLGSDGRLYAHHHAVELAAHVDLPRLKQSWACLAAQTEILRTTFHFSTAMNKWLAAVHQESSDTWAELGSRTSTSDSLNDITKHSVFREEADFEQPPWGTIVLKTAKETVLAVSMHHSLYDGESINLLFRDLARLYEGIDLQPRVPFSDAARAILKSSTDAEDYWVRELEGFERSKHSPSPKAIETDTVQIETTLKMSMGSILQGCKALGVTTQTIALLAFAKSLACVSGRRDIVFGHVVGGRSLVMPGADDVAGPLFNTVPARVIFDKTYITNKAAALEIQHASGDSQPHQHASLGRIQHAWRQKIGDANAQLFDALFVFQNTANKASSSSGLWTPLDFGEAVAPTEYPTNFEFEQRQEAIILRLASHRGLRTPEQLQIWLTDFSEAFQDILEQPQRSVLVFPAPLQSLPLTNTSNHKSHHQYLQDDIEPGPDIQCVRTALSAISGFALEDIPLNASIFSLGLDSISAIQVAARCRKDGYTVSVADVLQGRSLAGICLRLRERRPAPIEPLNDTDALISTESRSKALVLARVNNEDDVEDVLPCLAGQVYHLARWLKSRRTMCEAVFTYQCSARVEMDGLKYAWRRLRERQSILRTIFVAISPKEALQVVLKPSALNDSSFKCTELSGDPDDGVIDQIKQDARLPFDLFSPPVKLSLLRGSTEDYVVLKLHHATYDAWTIRTIIADLASLYHNTPLAPPPRFDSFVAHTIHSLHTPTTQEYWRKSLNQHQRTLLQPAPSTAPTPLTTTLTIPNAIPHLRSLTTLSHRTPTTLPTLLLLAYARALSHLTHVAHPTFGLYQAARSAPFSRIDELCAPCVNITPVVVPYATEAGAVVVETLGRLQRDLAERVEFEQVVLGEVVRWVGGGVGEGELGFNTFVNILWGEGEGGGGVSELAESSTTTTTTTTKTTAAGSPNPLFTPWQPGRISIATPPSSQTTHGSTTIDSLDVSYLAEKNLYLDIVRNNENDCVDFSIRCDGELMDEEKARVFAGNIAKEVDNIVLDLRRAEVRKHGQERGGGGGRIN